MTELAHRTMVALTPQDVPGAQVEIADWCKAKIIELSHELRDARQNLRQAKKMKWRHQGWIKVANTTIKRMLYYVKIRAAVKAGYLIVPNFTAEILAVRVAKEKPRFATGAYPTQINEAKPDLLPPGEGRYVDETLPHTDYSYTDVHDKLVRRVVVGEAGYDETVDFPVIAIKPVILAATQQAMALNIFDRIGISFGDRTISDKRRRSDPVVVGQIIDHIGKYGHKGNMVTFFIAWWLDTRSL